MIRCAILCSPLLILLIGCSQPPHDRGCERDEQCGTNMVCNSGACVPDIPECPAGRQCWTQCCEADEECVAGMCVPSCSGDTSRCGEECCQLDEACLISGCCDSDSVCGEVCCAAEESCRDNRCSDCPRELCNDECCDSGEVCLEVGCCDGDRICGEEGCCGRGEECVEGSCVETCVGVRCDGTCCEPGEVCLDDRCQLPCEMDLCGGLCCSRGELCVADECCPSTRACDETCCADGTWCDGDGGCVACDRPLCNSTCCPIDEVCYAGGCCVEERICSDECCEPGSLCEGETCHLDCGEGLRCSSDDGSEACCIDEQVCFLGECIVPETECTFDGDCGFDEYCDEVLLVCLGIPESECEYHPPIGEFTPVIGCRWVPVSGEIAGSSECEMTPVVANLTDDNDDGATDLLDIPDIVFVSYDKDRDGCCTNRGVVRVVSGACNEDGTMNTHATLGRGDPWIGASSGIALGNLHPHDSLDEGPAEIVATSMGGGTVAWTRTVDDGSEWEILWRNPTYLRAAHTPGAGAQPHIADLDLDGAAEVIIGNVVLNGLTGELIWDGRVTVGPTSGIGNNAFLGPNTTVADLDLDGWPEVIAGNTVYDGRTGAEIWTYEYTTNNSGCGGDAECDGFNAVGNFDEDDEGEVVIIRLGEVFVIHHDGTLLHRVPIPWDDCRRSGARANESGPPTVADFDGDGNPEIGTASADFYVVIDFDCVGDELPEECESENVLWTVPNEDCSSRVTGSSVFDFEGDGRAEVVYADEVTFRIFDGLTGDILFEDNTHRSNTRMEMPIIVDVDNDGQAEVIVPEPNVSASRGGIEVWDDADGNWVRTRRIWNQHSYHVTNINEDGTVPSPEAPNWTVTGLNNFRQNVQTYGVHNAPNVVPEDFFVSDRRCPEQYRLGVHVMNRGSQTVPAGLLVGFYEGDPEGEHTLLGAVTIDGPLLSGGGEFVSLVWEVPDELRDPGRVFSFYVVVDDTELGDEVALHECHEEDNIAGPISASCEIL